MSRRRVRRGGIALVLITLAFAGSASLRLGTVVGEAMALSTESDEGAAAPLICPDPPLAVVEALKLRESRLSAAEASLTDREAAVALAETVIATRLEELRAAEEQLSATLALADGAAENDLARLTTVYENMKPKDAAALFEAMDPEFATGFLGRMQPAAAASILAGMSADKAYAVSVLLAGRNSMAPKN
jgi:flagellar motility protein MotE (MotC chaperone)